MRNKFSQHLVEVSHLFHGWRYRQYVSFDSFLDDLPDGADLDADATLPE